MAYLIEPCIIVIQLSKIDVQLKILRCLLIGCHYVDQVFMITGLLPVQISVYGIKETYPNGDNGYLKTDARIRVLFNQNSNGAR